MTNDGYHDEFDFYSPQPINRATRRQPGADFPTGPDIGAVLPEIQLPNQHGNIVDVARNRGANGAIVVFHRSAHW